MTFSDVPWALLVTILVPVAAIAVVLMRDRLREPDHFVTSKSLEHLEVTVTKDIQTLRDEIRGFRQECATMGDLNGYGDRLSRVEHMQGSINDRTASAQNDARQALGEVLHIKEDVKRIEARVSDVAGSVSGLPAQIGELKGMVEILIRKGA